MTPNELIMLHEFLYGVNEAEGHVVMPCDAQMCINIQ